MKSVGFFRFIKIITARNRKKTRIKAYKLLELISYMVLRSNLALFRLLSELSFD